MVLFSCDNKRDCVVLAVVASLVVGIVTAFLRITAVITVTPAFLWAVLGVAVVYLAVLVAAAVQSQAGVCKGCGSALSALLTGILGTALLAVVLLAIPFVATSVIGAIITGLLLFFFALILTASACLVKCATTYRD